jgi:hypothetical protein
MVYSDDGGVTWSAPAATGIADYPADLAELNDGRVVCAAGRRRAPFGITLYLSTDAGKNWGADRPVFVRSDLPNRDLGYPTVALRRDGSLFVAYYAQDRDGVTGIHTSVLPEGWADGRNHGAGHGQG